MKIVSKFVDVYDFEVGVDRDDTVIYHRDYKSEKVAENYGKPSRKRSNPLGDLPEGIYLKLGNTIKHFDTSHRASDLMDVVADLVDYRVDSLGGLEKVERTNRARGWWGWSTHFGITYMADSHGCEYSGKVFVNKKMIEFLKISDSTDVSDNNQLKDLLDKPVALLVITKGRTEYYVQDFSISASGLHGVFALHFGDNLAAQIDMSLSTIEVEDTFEISDKDQIQRKGFDNKISFRHRKGV